MRISRLHKIKKNITTLKKLFSLHFDFISILFWAYYLLLLFMRWMHVKENFRNHDEERAAQLAQVQQIAVQQIPANKVMISPGQQVGFFTR